MRRARLIDVASTPAKSQRVARLVRYIETVGGYVTMAEASAVTGAAKGGPLDSMLADAMEAEPRLFEGIGIVDVPFSGTFRPRRVAVLGLLDK